MNNNLLKDSINYARGIMPVSERPKNKFFIFAQGRTGSTLLCRLLDQHSQICCAEEIFHDVWRPFPTIFASGMSKNSDKPVFGFKVKIYQLIDQIAYPEPSVFLQKMHNNGWKIIYLWRRNVLRQAVSREIAKTKNKWHNNVQQNIDLLEKVYISPQNVLQKAREKEQYLKSEKQALGNLPHLTINYENDLFYEELHNRTLKRIFDYLDLPFEKTTPSLNRTSVDDLSKMIQNYDAFEQAIRASEFQHLLQS